MKSFIVILLIIVLYLVVGYIGGPAEQCEADPTAIYTSTPTKTQATPVATTAKPIISSTIHNTEPLPTPTIAPVPRLTIIPKLTSEPWSYTEKEKKLIARVVSGEANGESFDGKVAVAEVVLNRVESGKFGKTVKSVVNAKNQFSVGSTYNAICMAAVEHAIKNRSLPSNTYYFQRANRKHWQRRPSIKRYCTIGAHTFYTQGEPEETNYEQGNDYR